MISQAGSPDICNGVSLDFVQSSILSTFVPLGNILDLEGLLCETINCYKKKNECPLASIPQRQILFFDETLSIYAILKTPSSYKRKLHLYLKRLSLTIAGQTFSSNYENNDVFPTHELIFTQSVRDIENPLLIIELPSEADESSLEKNIYVVWKVSVFLDRAKIRIQNPSILFTVRAMLRPTDNIIETVNDEYLPSQVPSAINLLEAFGNDSSIDGVKPRLSALRVSRVTPTIQPSIKNSCRFKIIASQPIKIHPAVNAKVRYSRVITVSTNVGVIISLEIDTTPYAVHGITIDQVRLHLLGGRIEDLSNKSGLSLPVTSYPMDSLAFTYILSLDESDGKTIIEDLEIFITATVNLSNVCQPLIEMHWMASLSFMSPVNPGFLAPSSAIKRYHKLNKLSIDVDIPDIKLPEVNPPSTQSGVLTSISAPTQHELSPSAADFGITVTFTISSTPSPIYPGTPFIWNVFILNRSNRLRKLVLIVMPKNSIEESLNSPPQSNPKERGLEIAEAVVDENLIYEVQRSSYRAIEVICLTTKQEVGPLSPMACHEIELKFVALDFGMIHVGAVRIVDLDTHTHVNVIDLPTVYISPLTKEM